MRIQLISDLHLERYPDYLPLAATSVDVLVLAGDIGSYQAGSRLGGDDFGLRRFSPAQAGSPWPRVLFVPGNHEFDGLDFDVAYARLRHLCDALGIEWLEKETIVIDGVRFCGTTLWSDFEALAKSEKTAQNHERVLQKAFRAANFYLRKNTALKDGQPLLAEDIRDMALTCQQWLRDALVRPFDGRTVAVTHFAPTLQSADPRYGLNPGTAGFCNALDDLLPWASVWIHGHLHCANDFQVSGRTGDRPFTCRVVSNARGYQEKGEQLAFREAFVIELPGGTTPG